MAHLIPDPIIWAREDNQESILEIKCETSDANRVSESFRSLFKTEWEREFREAVGDDDLEDDFNPLPLETITVNNQFITATFDSLYYNISEDYGKCNEKTLEIALKNLITEYPDIKYRYIVIYCWSDLHGGETDETYGSNYENDDVADYDYLISKWVHDARFDEERLEYELVDVDEDDLIDVVKFMVKYKNDFEKDVCDLILKDIEGSIIENDFSEALDVLLSSKLLGIKEIDGFIELSAENDCTEITAALLDYKNKNFTAEEIEAAASEDFDDEDDDE